MSGGFEGGGFDSNGSASCNVNHYYTYRQTGGGGGSGGNNGGCITGIVVVLVILWILSKCLGY